MEVKMNFEGARQGWNKVRIWTVGTSLEDEKTEDAQPSLIERFRESQDEFIAKAGKWGDDWIRRRTPTD